MYESNAARTIACAKIIASPMVKLSGKSHSKKNRRARQAETSVTTCDTNISEKTIQMKPTFIKLSIVFDYKNTERKSETKTVEGIAHKLIQRTKLTVSVLLEKLN